MKFHVQLFDAQYSLPSRKACMLMARCANRWWSQTDVLTAIFATAQISEINLEVNYNQRSVQPAHITDFYDYSWRLSCEINFFI